MATSVSPLPPEDDSNTTVIPLDNQRVKYINNSFKKVRANMYDLQCDIKLKVGSANFRAHKSVLSEASMYFEAMFGHNMKEKEQPVIELHELSPKGFGEMMEYFYHGYVTVGSGNVADLLEAARFFHIEWLVGICCDYLINKLSLDNYTQVLHLADKYYLGDLKQQIFHFVSLNFMSLAKSEDLLNASPEILHTLLGENYYIEAQESFIFQTLLKWLACKPEERRPHQADLLKLIKFPLLTPGDLQAMPSNLRALPDILPLVEQAEVYHSNPPAQCLLTSERSEPRGARDALVLIEAVEDAQTFLYKVAGVEGFLRDNTDTSFMDSVLEFASVAVLGNFLFVVGGYDRHTWCSSPACYQYDPKSRQWFELSSMQRPRVSFPLVVGSGGLYAVAGIEHIVEDGLDKENIHSTVEEYDPETNSWTLLPELPTGKFSCAATTCKHNLYVSGGITSDPEDNVPVNYVQVYLSADQTWHALAPMLTPRQSHSMECVEDKLFVLGGYTDGQDTMSFDHCYQNEMYDVELDQWSRVADIPVEMGHWFGSSVVKDDTIYVLGGDAASSERSLYSYRQKDDQIGEGEFCGPCVQKVVRMKVPVPNYLLDGE